MSFDRKLALSVSVLLLVLAPAFAQEKADPLDRIDLPPLDLASLQAEDAAREAAGLAPRFAIPHPTLINPQTAGTWETFADGTQRWRFRIVAAGAPSLNLGFGGYVMPEAGELRIAATDGHAELRPFTAADNELHGELWTPVILADDIVLDLRLPPGTAQALILDLTSINVGYRLFGAPSADKSGWCNVDVVCPEGDAWRAEIASVGVISTGGSLFCTGFMVNNTANDTTPFFMTANHCGINSGNAASLVVYWNFESPVCGDQSGGSLSEWQSGSFFRASYSASDFTLVELDDDPNPAWNVTFAGWDRSTSDPPSACAIHHPNCDEKSISFEYDSTSTTSYLGNSSPGDGTHIRITDWDVGTTEPGSSGSPLFDQNHRVVGQLHGGYAACGNDSSDWYGRFSRSWTGGGSNSTRLSNWLDSGNTGVLYVNTLLPGVMEIIPSGDFASSGPPGGPFVPVTKIYGVHNAGTTPINYAVTESSPWLDLTNSTGSLPAGGTVGVTITLTGAAASLPPGTHTAEVSFTNLTSHAGDATRLVTLTVGSPRAVYAFQLDTDPAWAMQGQWAFGPPDGLGGELYGFEDPAAGYTGQNVYGVNLGGDYATTPGGPYALTLGPLNLLRASETTLRFRRWLNTDHFPYVDSRVQASTDGATWIDVWEAGSTVIKESAWSTQALDLAAVADGQPAVYVRWTYKINSWALPYAGWNIDDIEIWAFAPELPPVCRGDCDCDGTIGFGDIDYFVAAIPQNYAAWAALFPGGEPPCAFENCDVNGDSTVGFDDIDPFVALIPSACP